LYKDKAFVSATPLDMRNPEFQKQGFFKLKVQPTFDYRKELTLITTNSYETEVIKLFEKLKDSECICVFMNSTNGINKLVNHLGEKDYKTFSSKKSEIKFKDKEIHNSFENLDLPLAKYNFFTSRFFSAVDINIDKKPDIIILTNLHEAKYSRIDPYTNAIQIYGRFRNPFADGKKFNSLTHITNYGDNGTVLLESEIQSYIDASKRIYELLGKELNEELCRGEKQAIIDSMKGSSYSKFIDENGSLNYFKIDNFYDDERVKGYYDAPDNIYNAYEETKHFFPINHTNMLNIVGSTDLLEYKKLRSKKQKASFLVKKLDAIYNSNRPFSSNEIELAKNEYRKVENRKFQAETEYIIDAYEKLGGKILRAVDYSKAKIDRMLKEYDKDADNHRMFSKRVRDAIIERFPENADYPKEELFRGFTEIFNSNGVNAKVNINTVRKYYGADPLKGKGSGIIKLYQFKPDFEYD